jgi:hypothetical protein
VHCFFWLGFLQGGLQHAWVADYYWISHALGANFIPEKDVGLLVIYRSVFFIYFIPH